MQNMDYKKTKQRSLECARLLYVDTPTENTLASSLYTSELTEICLVEEGRGIHQILEQALPCKEGDIYILPPNVPHNFFVQEKGERVQVRRMTLEMKDWFEGEVLRRDHPRYCFGAFQEGGVVAYALLNSETRRLISDLMDRIETECAKEQQEWRQSVSAHLSLMMITVGRYISDAIQELRPLQQKDWQAVLPVIRLVGERFADSELTLESIADSLFVSQSHLSRLFKKLTGRSFSEYLRQTRLQYACRLLRDGELTVEEVVSACGLKDVPSFYHSFHTYTGMTPSQYRSANQHKGEKIMVILSEISEHLQKGKAKIVKEMVMQAIEEGCEPGVILEEGLLAGMNVVGEKFHNNEIFVPEVLVAARAMKMGAEVLKPYLLESGVKATGKVCIGTVQGDLHDIGKNLVKMMMEGKGLEVIDLGTDVAPETFVQTAKEQNCQVICCSALLTTTMDVMAEVVKAAEAAGIRDQVKIMVGGAPINEDFCKKIGADCYTSDAAAAAAAAVELCK